MFCESKVFRMLYRECGRPSFQFLLNAPGSTPGHSYLRLLRKCRLNLGIGNNVIYQRVKQFDGNLWDDLTAT